jgi:hypothetical protein
VRGRAEADVEKHKTRFNWSRGRLNGKRILQTKALKKRTMLLYSKVKCDCLNPRLMYSDHNCQFISH